MAESSEDFREALLNIARQARSLARRAQTREKAACICV